MDTVIGNKRGLQRLKLKTPLHYQVRGRPDFDNTVCEDISLGGVGFITDRFIPPQTTLMFEINILSRILNPIGKIAWVKSMPYSDRFRLGVKFLGLSLPDRNYLSDYINMHMENSTERINL